MEILPSGDDRDMGGSGVESFVNDRADVVSEATRVGSELLKAVDNPSIHAEGAHDEKGDGINCGDINFCLPPLLNPIDC